jgi:hypothetical protein
MSIGLLSRSAAFVAVPTPTFGVLHACAQVECTRCLPVVTLDHARLAQFDGASNIGCIAMTLTNFRAPREVDLREPMEGALGACPGNDVPG